MNRSKRVSLYSLLEDAALAGTKLQRDDGSFPPGTNGPYNEGMTPVRNTANWLKLLSTVYDRTENETIYCAAKSAIEYLEQPERRPDGYTFHCRTTPEKDSCNGVVGQAIVIEALTAAARYLERPNVLETAEEVYQLLPFNESVGVWNRVEIDGSVLPIDRTFNHQLILAAASSALSSVSKSEKIRRDVSKFLETLPRNLALHESGVVVHRLRPRIELKDVVDTLRDRSPELLINPILHTKEQIFPSSERCSKELGYQAVNLYWLANLKSRVPNHSIWPEVPVEAMLNVTEKSRYRARARNSIGWFRSIVPGFQVAHAINIFSSSPVQDELEYWVSMALKNHYSRDRDLFVKNCEDEETFSGMLYQAASLPDIEIKM